MRRAATSIVLAGLVALAAGAVTATAHNVRYPITATFKYDAEPTGDAFKGKVRSEKRRCVRKRRVKVRRERPGRDEKIGRRRTNRKGRWQLKLGGPAEPGSYYARVKKRDIGPEGHDHVCKGTKTPEIEV